MISTHDAATRCDVDQRCRDTMRRRPMTPRYNATSTARHRNVMQRRNATPSRGGNPTRSRNATTPLHDVAMRQQATAVGDDGGLSPGSGAWMRSRTDGGRETKMRMTVFRTGSQAVGLGRRVKWRRAQSLAQLGEAALSVETMPTNR